MISLAVWGSAKDCSSPESWFCHTESSVVCHWGKTVCAVVDV